MRTRKVPIRVTYSSHIFFLEVGDPASRYLGTKLCNLNLRFAHAGSLNEPESQQHVPFRCSKMGQTEELLEHVLSPGLGNHEKRLSFRLVTAES